MYILIIAAGAGIFFYFSKEIDNRATNGYYEKSEDLNENLHEDINKMQAEIQSLKEENEKLKGENE
ncbi:hypothetical protein [Staphylococcus gallinarum]|uniref:hypothetical protein n=1 Tax=Staphylococcus gallinarum TaxID=1293 RepID=UPI0030BD1BA3